MLSYRLYCKKNIISVKIFSTPGHYSDKLSKSNDEQEATTKIVNFMTPGAGFSFSGHGRIGHIVKILAGKPPLRL